MVDGLLVEKVGRNGLLDDLLEDLLAEVLGGDVCAVLGGDDNSVDSPGDDSAVVVLVLNSDLSLGVWSEPWQGAVLGGIVHGLVQLVGELDGQWQHLRSLVGGVSKHDTLVTGTEVLQALLVVETLCNVWALLFNGD